MDKTYLIAVIIILVVFVGAIITVLIVDKVKHPEEKLKPAEKTEAEKQEEKEKAAEQKRIRDKQENRVRAKKKAIKQSKKKNR